ncbi:MAG: 2-hydroxychromene-2-carboxylate isomerase [Deltaproteobacteria bacterium]|nr:2-hydroxychromene-2-carboxylate isomerase [Deltaproteobacteria bacterium]MBW2445379.1 2-hydroxychromene-2-carboxylate isomerase [Deltaproteobacteria bacterium]
MSKKLEYFFDYVSPFSYLADSQVPGLVQRTGAELIYRPFFLGGVMQASGNSPPATVPAKGAYMGVDIARWLDRYGLEFKFNPNFPVMTVKPMRAALVALEQGVFPQFHQAMFKAMWREEKNIGDAEVLAEVLSSAGLDAPAILGRIGDDDVKEHLKANTAEAVERGAFGAPTFYVEGEMFFGNDRLDFLEAKLAS